MTISYLVDVVARDDRRRARHRPLRAVRELLPARRRRPDRPRRQLLPQLAGEAPASTTSGMRSALLLIGVGRAEEAGGRRPARGRRRQPCTRTRTGIGHAQRPRPRHRDRRLRRPALLRLLRLHRHRPRLGAAVRRRAAARTSTARTSRASVKDFWRRWHMSLMALAARLRLHPARRQPRLGPGGATGNILRRVPRERHLARRGPARSSSWGLLNGAYQIARRRHGQGARDAAWRASASIRTAGSPKVCQWRGHHAAHRGGLGLLPRPDARPTRSTSCRGCSCRTLPRVLGARLATASSDSSRTAGIAVRRVRRVVFAVEYARSRVDLLATSRAARSRSAGPVYLALILVDRRVRHATAPRRPPPTSPTSSSRRGGDVTGKRAEIDSGHSSTAPSPAAGSSRRSRSALSSPSRSRSPPRCSSPRARATRRGASGPRTSPSVRKHRRALLRHLARLRGHRSGHDVRDRRHHRLRDGRRDAGVPDHRVLRERDAAHAEAQGRRVGDGRRGLRRDEPQPGVPAHQCRLHAMGDEPGARDLRRHAARRPRLGARRPLAPARPPERSDLERLRHRG